MISSVWSAHDQWSQRTENSHHNSVQSLPPLAFLHVRSDIVDHDAIVFLALEGFEKIIPHATTLDSAPVDHEETLGPELLAELVALPAAAPNPLRLPPWPVDSPLPLPAGEPPVQPRHDHPGLVPALGPHVAPHPPGLHPPPGAPLWGHQGEAPPVCAAGLRAILAEILWIELIFLFEKFSLLLCSVARTHSLFYFYIQKL